MSGEKTYKSEIDHLKELIRQSGFPLEIEVASFLDSARNSMNLKDMEVSMGAYYIDKDKQEEKGRPLDIKVTIPIKYKTKRKGKPHDITGIFLNLLIQCKRIPGNRWVFFKTPQETFSIPQSTSVLDSLKWVPRAYVDFAYSSELHYRNVQQSSLCHEYVLDANKSNRRVDNLFEAKITLAKATTYERDTVIQSLKDTINRFTDVLDYPPNFVELFYPIVVFDGKMYLAEKTDQYGEMNPTPIDHICLFFHYVSGNYNIDVYIDIVEREAFEKFFSSIVKDIENLRKALESKVGIKFRQEVTKALRWYLSKKSVRYQPTL